MLASHGRQPACEARLLITPRRVRAAQAASLGEGPAHAPPRRHGRTIGAEGIGGSALKR